MFLFLAQALFFLLPAYVANGIPIVLAKMGLFKSLNIPVDFGYKIKGEPVFGETKTYRGIFGGIIAALIVAGLQLFFYHYHPQYHYLYLFPYESTLILLLGYLQGLGVGLGDLFKSYWKRRRHIKSTEPFVPWDQMDSWGAVFLSLFIFIPPWPHLVAMLLLSPLVLFLANVIAYLFKWKKVWW